MRKVIIMFLLCSSFNYSYSQFNILEEAYKKKSEKKLEDFLDHWRKDILPISDKEYQALLTTEKAVYDVFYAFYNPIDLQRIGSSEWGDTIYQNTKYIIIQHNLQYRVQNKVFYTEDEKIIIYKKLLKKEGQDGIDSLNLQKIPAFAEERLMKELLDKDIISTDTITNFRPNISFRGKEVVYLSPSYNIELTTFLGTRIKKNKEALNYLYYLSDKEVAKRQCFLEKKIKIWRGHWGAYWQLLTYPQVYTIVFDKEMNYAKLFFRLVYEGGEAYLKKENGRWNLISSKLTWIE